MKSLFTLATLMTALILQGATIFPGLPPENPDGLRPNPRLFKGKAKAAVQSDSILIETFTPDGSMELNFHRVPAPEADTLLYCRVPFEILERGDAPSRKVSARVIFFDKENKLLSKVTRFPEDIFPETTGKYDIFFTFKIPKGAVKYSFTFWFAGIKKLRINKVISSRNFPADSSDGNLILNGGFETPNLASYYFRLVSAPVKFFERTTDKAKSGRWSLRARCEDPGKGLEINFMRLAHTPEKKFVFKGSYFVASKEGKTRLSGRVMFLDAKEKVIRYLFPEFPGSTGEWHDINLSFHPPKNCVRVVVTLWYSGKQTVYLDDFYYGIIEEKKMANRNAGALLLKESADCTLWKEAPYLKAPASGAPAGLKSSSTIEIAAAANESEPFQIVVTPKKKLSNVTLAFSPLKGKGGVIPAGALSFRRVGFVNLKNPDNPTLKGLNADPLLPEQKGSAAANENLPFFVVAAVPAGTAPGIYDGEISVLSDAGVLGKFNLKLRVFDFQLPDSPHMRSYFYILPHPGYNVWDKRPLSEKVENFHKLIKDHRMTGNQALWLPIPKWEIKNGSLIITDWSKFDAQAAYRINRYGQRNLPVPILTMKGDNDGWFGPKGQRDKPGKSPFGNFNLISPEGLKYAGQYAAAFTAHVKEKFPGTDFFAYIYDEPPAKVHADLKIFLDSLHKAAPDLKILIPKLVTDQIGYVHTFAVPFAPGYYHPENQAAHMKKGGDVWYYNWTVRLSNHDYIHNRLYSWKIYAGGGNGGLLWCTNWTYKDVNPWTDFDRTGYGSGGATIFYPPRKPGEGNISSQRAAMIRESIDDFDYMRILEQLIDKSYPGVGRTRVMEILKVLLPEPPFGYVNDSHLLYRLRSELAEEIEEFKKFPAVVTSIPSGSSKVEVSSIRMKISAPAGTEVKINGRKMGKVTGKLLEVPVTLEKIGVNKVEIELALKGKVSRMSRTYELAADPRLKELEELIARGGKEKTDVRNAAAFMAQVKKGGAYTEKERALTEKFVGELKYALASKALNAKRNFVNPLEKFFFERAREVFGWKLFERSEYYLGLAGEAAKAGSMEKFKVKVTPALFREHGAIVLDNGIVRATILETGGTLVSFKINGVETLSPGPFSKLLSPQQRAARKVTRDMITALSGYDGFTDAGGGGIWPVAFTDWDISFRQLSSDRVSITFSTALPGTMFHLKRTMSLKSGSPDLVMDYEITNLMSPDSASDDPEHLQLPWRGRFLTAIGSGTLPQQNDKLVVPVKYQRDKLEEALFTVDKPLFFERRSVKLEKPFMGVYDTVLKKGLAIIGGPVTSHAYVWFSSKGNHKGTGKVYTMEFCRSFFGKKYDDAEPNAPITIRPGKTLNFTVTLRGLSHVKDDADLVKQTGL